MARVVSGSSIGGATLSSTTADRGCDGKHGLTASNGRTLEHTMLGRWCGVTSSTLNHIMFERLKQKSDSCSA